MRHIEVCLENYLKENLRKYLKSYSNKPKITHLKSTVVIFDCLVKT